MSSARGRFSTVRPVALSMYGASRLSANVPAARNVRCWTALLALVALLSFPSLAPARELSPHPTGGGLVENPDGTWSFYGEGISTPFRTYTSAEHEVIRRLGAGLELDTGTTGQTASAVNGIAKAEVEQAQALANILRTEELYRSRGEAAVGNSVIATDEAAATLPSKVKVLAAAEEFTAGVGLFLVGVGVEAGIGELYAFPPITEHNGLFAFPDPSQDNSTTRNYEKHFHYLNEIRLDLTPRTCEEEVSHVGASFHEAMLASFQGYGFALTDNCTSAAMRFDKWSTFEELHEGKWTFQESTPVTSIYATGNGETPPALVCPTNWLPCVKVTTEADEEIQFYVDDIQAHPAAFPAPNVNTLNTASEPSAKAVPHQEALTTPVAPAGPTVGLTREVEFILYNSSALLPGIEGPGVPNPLEGPRESSTTYGSENPSTNEPHPNCGDPVSCATGNFFETETDFAIGGRGVGLNLTRTYNSQVAAEGIKGVFGYGWTSSFSDHLVVNKTSKLTTLYQANGSTVPFTEEGGGAFKAPSWTQDILSGTEGTGYTLTLAKQVKYKFAGSSGRLESVTERDGNATTLAYNEVGRLTTITDPVGRTIKLAYNGESLVESAEDPMKHVVKYKYEGGSLKSVTQPGESGLRWQFSYDSAHEITEATDGRGGKTVNEYNGAHQVVSQTDPAGRTLAFAYEPLDTKITNLSAGSVTDEKFTSSYEPWSITRGYGTASATTEDLTYSEGGYLTGVTDGAGHTTTYGYSGAGDRTSMIDPDKNETKWKYDSTHDVETVTTPKGETTTIKRDAHGNPEVIERPAPASKTQVTKYKHSSTGELESMEDPLKRVWKYEYDSKGDRTAEIDPLSSKRTWEYNEDSQEVATVSPRGNVTGGKPAEFTTKIERDAQGRTLTVTDPLKHTTKYAYDGDGNVEKVTDGNGHTTTYTYNGDDEPTTVEAPNKTVTESEYDGAGQVVKQIDGNKHTTEYKRNAVEEVVETIDPLKHKTLKEYDAAGNCVKLTDSKGRATTYKYDTANRLIEVSYSSGDPSPVKYEYDKDGDRTTITDGTGTTTYGYDQLDRLIESENGHKEVIKYEYDLANEQTKITYPNKKAVTRAFDKDGRLEKVTDWNSKAVKFSYSGDSELTLTTFPGEPVGEDKYFYNDADQMNEVKMLKGTETVASLVYTHDSDGQVKKTTSKELPGAEITEGTYDENSRLIQYGSTEYKYDAADNPTKEGASENKYNEANELEKATGVSYSYDEMGERTKATPEKGPAFTYSYDQAGELTSVERPEGESKPKIEDGYAFNGEGLRTSQTISGTTSYFAWDTTEPVALVLADGVNSYIYGPGGLPVEQINTTTGTALYLHHDQAGSTRMLTSATGTKEASFTYDAYGNTTGTTGTAKTPLGYDGQYTSQDTGLIYLRARTYDPATAQFLTVDPLKLQTREPYGYVSDNPLNGVDRSGLSEVELELPCFWPFCGATPEAIEGLKELGEGVVEGAEITWQAIEGGWNEVFAGSGCSAAADGEALRREGEQLLGRKHGEAARERWREWWAKLGSAEKKTYNKAKGPKPRKGG